jgi:DNA-directed RNA polymerase subunit RPC12/RpoP
MTKKVKDNNKKNDIMNGIEDNGEVFLWICENCGEQLLSNISLLRCSKCGSKNIKKYNHHTWDALLE